MSKQSPEEYEYELFFESTDDEPCRIDGWWPIATSRIRHPEQIPELIAKGRLRKISPSPEIVQPETKPPDFEKMAKDRYYSIVEMDHYYVSVEAWKNGCYSVWNSHVLPLQEENKKLQYSNEVLGSGYHRQLLEISNMTEEIIKLRQEVETQQKKVNFYQPLYESSGIEIERLQIELHEEKKNFNNIEKLYFEQEKEINNP